MVSSEVRSACSSAGDSSIILRTAGTTVVMVTRCREISSSRRPGSAVLATTVCDPLASERRPSEEPVAWKTGMATRTQAASSTRVAAAISSLAIKARLLNITPLGRPVVPEVYICIPVSSGPTEVIGSLADWAASSSW
jgi:hypothetical protein